MFAGATSASLGSMVATGTTTNTTSVATTTSSTTAAEEERDVIVVGELTVSTNSVQAFLQYYKWSIFGRCNCSLVNLGWSRISLEGVVLNQLAALHHVDTSRVRVEQLRRNASAPSQLLFGYQVRNPVLERFVHSPGPEGIQRLRRALQDELDRLNSIHPLNVQLTAQPLLASLQVGFATTTTATLTTTNAANARVILLEGTFFVGVGDAASFSRSVGGDGEAKAVLIRGLRTMHGTDAPVHVFKVQAISSTLIVVRYRVVGPDLETFHMMPDDQKVQSFLIRTNVGLHQLGYQSMSGLSLRWPRKFVHHGPLTSTTLTTTTTTATTSSTEISSTGTTTSLTTTSSTINASSATHFLRVEGSLLFTVNTPEVLVRVLEASSDDPFGAAAALADAIAGMLFDVPKAFAQLMRVSLSSLRRRLSLRGGRGLAAGSVQVEYRIDLPLTSDSGQQREQILRKLAIRTPSETLDEFREVMNRNFMREGLFAMAIDMPSPSLLTIEALEVDLTTTQRARTTERAVRRTTAAPRAEAVADGRHHHHH